jgi:hypothetical protein
MSTPRLTLCVIARNEAANLPGCLASVRGVVDAVVVVDTGSTDDTVHIAREAGATVVEFPWVDDFAAARNAALPHADGDFLLVLDADERLAPDAGPALREALLRSDLDCGLLPLHDAPSEDASVEQVLQEASTLLPRLLRRTPDLRWVGCVHESIAAWLEPRRERVQLVGAPILHYGAVASVRARLGKSDRNIALLRRRVEAEPANPTPLALLGEELLFASRPEEAYEAIDRAWALCVAAWEPADGGSPASHPPPARLLMRYAARRLEQGDVEAASDAVAKVVGWVGDAHPVVRFFRSRIEEIAGDSSDGDARRAWYVRALHGYRTCAQQHRVAFSEPVPPTVTGDGACARLAVVLLKLGEAEHARSVVNGAIEQHGPNVHLRCARAEAAALLREPAAVLEAIGHDGAGDPLDVPDALALAAEACARLGDIPRAAELARRAAASPHWLELHRVDRLERLAEALGI